MYVLVLMLHVYFWSAYVNSLYVCMSPFSPEGVWVQPFELTSLVAFGHLCFVTVVCPARIILLVGPLRVVVLTLCLCC